MMIPEPSINHEAREAPESFEELAAGIERKLQKMDEDVKEMHEVLREADANSEALGRRLLGRAPA